jgi:hypothetical protein
MHNAAAISGRRTLKLLAFSDLHRDVAAARRIVSASADADVLVGPEISPPMGSARLIPSKF